MKFIADLHVHSRLSRATAGNLDLEHLYIAAQLKGITVVATGDFTHPGWFAELREKLVPAEPGLFRLRDDLAAACDREVPDLCRGEVRFILETEISNIYKKNDRTRKNHNLVYLPDFDTAARFNARLSAVGNLKSDGRPILGLDARHLLEILLDVSETGFLVPAHIWTPWFSLFGSKSGFDSMTECFEDLAPEIFAVETGLSSDAPMNWRVSELDSRTLISNSDAHSPDNLGRNANRFDTELSFHAIRDALKQKDPDRCPGTLDLYPQEGKYHMDGHRKCDVWLPPSDSIARGDICPVCEKPLTLGVRHRVEALADRPEGETPPNALPYRYIIPLPEILSELLDVGPRTKTVASALGRLHQHLGPELELLLNCPADEIAAAGIPLLDEAIRRMRAGEIRISPGYDGAYGRITVFDPHEKESLMGQQSLFGSMKKESAGTSPVPPRKSVPVRRKRKKQTNAPVQESSPGYAVSAGRPGDLNPDQRQAVRHEGSPLLIVAGPGAGKTRTLTHRIVWLLQERNISPDNILAVTFTNKAAQEMRERLALLLENAGKKPEHLPLVATFHGLALRILREEEKTERAVADEDERADLMAEAVRQARSAGREDGPSPEQAGHLISLAKQYLLTPDDDLSFIADLPQRQAVTAVYALYQSLLERMALHDFDDLILKTVRLFDTADTIRQKYADRFQHMLVDEYQDVNPGQYRMVRALAPPDRELCVIGDPDQSIYGFRGSDVRYFSRFTKDYPRSRTIRLTRNYRSTETILEASRQMMNRWMETDRQARIYSGIEGIKTLTVIEQRTEKAEAVAVGKWIESLVGGTGFHSIDFGKTAETGMETDRSFSDFAVLYRSHAQSRIIAEVFERAGIPFQVVSRKQVYDQKEIAVLLATLRIAEGQGTFRDLEKVARSRSSGISRAALDTLKHHYFQQPVPLPAFFARVQRIPFPGMKTPVQRKLCDLIRGMEETAQALAGKSAAEKLTFLSDRTGLAVRCQADPVLEETVERLFRFAAGFGDDAAAFLQAVALQTDPDTCQNGVQRVTLMTLHAAKGLEFPVVFITGCENGLIPFLREGEEPDLAEERRLFYVGMTRARDRLFLTRALQRTLYGRTTEREASPFVQDIEKKLITLEKRRARKPEKSGQVQLDLFG